MSYCDDCGGDYGHSPGCRVAAAYSASQSAVRKAEVPLNAKLQAIRGERDSAERKTSTLRKALLDILTSESFEEAKRIAKRALG